MKFIDFIWRGFLAWTFKFSGPLWEIGGSSKEVFSREKWYKQSLMFVYFSLDVIVKEIFLILCIVQTLAAWKKHTWAIRVWGYLLRWKLAKFLLGFHEKRKKESPLNLEWKFHLLTCRGYCVRGIKCPKGLLNKLYLRIKWASEMYE